MANASFSWSDSAVLSNVALSVPPGRLVLGVGPVASGKSTLLSGLFGFAQRSCGSSSLRGWGPWGSGSFSGIRLEMIGNSLCEKAVEGLKFQ